MLIEHIFLGFCGLAAGLAVSAGTFAFLIVIGVIPRMIGKCNRAAETLHFENAVILGGICGNLASVFLQIRIPFLCVYGISAGIFVGSIAVALAEILNTFPITFRRMGLKVGLFWVMLAMAAGKVAGSLYYFLGNFKSQ